jgi:hypothetical protein
VSTIEPPRVGSGARVLLVLGVLHAAFCYSPLSSVRSVHSELAGDDAKTCPGGACAKMATRMAAAVPKVVRKVIPAPRPHWVGNGFHVFPVFGELAFTEELSPWLMFDYAAPKVFEPSTTRRGVGQVCCVCVRERPGAGRARGETLSCTCGH